MAIIFQRPALLPLLLVVVGLGVLAIYAHRKRRSALAQFSGCALNRTAWLSPLLLCLSTFLLVLALARPAWRREPVEVERGGRDVLFLLDVSRSMLAADIAPDRLSSAKRAILDCVEGFEGHRIGLVTFAGSPSIACPLTTDYSFFRKMLEEASPENVDQGGTRIGDALRKSVDKLLDPDRAGLQDIILISDGGDQESSPAKAAAELDELGVFLVAIGVGDEVTGARVPARPQGDQNNPRFTLHEGREIWSRLEPNSLRAMAEACAQGAYINAGISGMDLGNIYLDLVRHLRAAGTNSPDSLLRWRDEFPTFLALALLALLASFLIPSTRVAAKSSKPALVALALCLTLPNPLSAQEREEIPKEETSNVESEDSVELTIPREPRRAYNMGCALLAEEKLSAASAFFQATTITATSAQLRARCWYNLGLAQLHRGDSIAVPDPAEGIEYYLGAARAFRAALDHLPDWDDAGYNLELARVRAHRTLQMLQRQEKQESEETENPSKSDAPDGEEGEPMEDEGYEGEFEETDADSEGSGPPSSQSSQTAMDLDNQDIPPPSLAPEDIFNEESQNNEAREKKGGNTYKPVEKDW